MENSFETKVHLYCNTSPQKDVRGKAELTAADMWDGGEKKKAGHSCWKKITKQERIGKKIGKIHKKKISYLYKFYPNIQDSPNSVAKLNIS